MSNDAGTPNEVTEASNEPAEITPSWSVDNTGSCDSNQECAVAAVAADATRAYVADVASADVAAYDLATGVASSGDGTGGGFPSGGPADGHNHELKNILQFMVKTATPALLPIFRSQQQAELLALLLGDPELELSLTELSRLTGIAHPSVYREVTRAEAAGLLKSRRVGRTRLVRADVESPYYDGLAEVLTRAFGVPAVVADAIRDIDGIEEAYLFGSWAARHAGIRGVRPVGDIDLLVLGTPDRNAVYDSLHVAERRLGREIQVTIRERGWVEHGNDAFHNTVVGRPMMRLEL